MNSYAAPLIGRRLLARAAGAAAGALLLLSTAHAVPQAFNDPASFNSFVASLGGSSQLLDFDSVPTGTVIPSGTAIGGTTFTYSLGDVSLQVINAFATTTDGNSLGTDDAWSLQAGDGFSLAFNGPANAVGMYFIVSPESDDLVLGDILIRANGFDAELSGGAPLYSLDDGGKVYFLGLGDSSKAFLTASILTNQACGCFLYNVDDITTAAVPEPSTLWLLAAGMAGLGLLRRHRSAKRVK